MKDIKEALAVCEDVFLANQRYRDELDRGMRRLLAGADIDPALLEEGASAADALLLHESYERMIWEHVLSEMLTSYYLRVEGGFYFDFNGVRPLGTKIKPLVGTPKDGPNPFEELWQRSVAPVGRRSYPVPGENPKSGFEEALEILPTLALVEEFSAGMKDEADEPVVISRKES